MANTISINGQNINLADIQAALEAKGLNIKDLAKEAGALKRGEIKNPEKKASTITTPTFKLALVNYPDFCIEKTTAKTRQLIVIMPSCQGYYVKSFKGGEEYVEELTSELYTKITSGMGDLYLPDGFWLKRVYSGKNFYGRLNKALKSETYIEMVKLHVAPTLDDMYLDGYYGIENNDDIKAYKNQPTLYREFFHTNKARRVLRESTKFIQNLITDFGLNNARDFLKQLELSLVEIDNNYLSKFPNHYSRKIYPEIEMKYEAFRDYVLYQSVFMGYGKTIATFLNEWCDSIRMQQDIYHKVKEKYHDNLPLWHHQLSYKSACMKDEIDEDKIKRMVGITSEYQGVCGKYVFIAPTCKQDFLDEAQMQQNCLASYIGKFTNGDCLIMFMRLKNTPTQSLVTIEIIKDDDGNYSVLNQKYQARNRACTQEQSDAIDKWLKRAINRVNKQKKGVEIEADEELANVLKSIER